MSLSSSIDGVQINFNNNESRTNIDLINEDKELQSTQSRLKLS